MAPADKDRGTVGHAAAALALRRQLSYSCSCGRAEPMHDRKLSYSYSFSSLAASPSSSTSYLSLSNKSSCESVPVPELDKQPSFSSTFSYESFFQLEAAAESDQACFSFLEFVPTTQAPVVQTMTAQGQPIPDGGANGFDPKRLPLSMFGTRSTSPAEWSVTSIDSLFSIQLSHSGEVGALYNDLYASGGFHRLPSAGHEAWKLPTVKEVSVGDASGGLCVRNDCARCSSGGKNRKSVRFASIESVSGESKHSVIFPTPADALEAEGPATEAKASGAGADGWCAFGCCCPSLPSMWWPRCDC